MYIGPMPTFVHECVVRLLEEHPLVLRQLCRLAGLPVPHARRKLEMLRPELPLALGRSSDVRHQRPDLFALQWRLRPKRLLEALWNIEVQACKDETRTRAWAANIILAAQYYKVEPETLIIALSRAIERWCIVQIADYLANNNNVLARARVLGPGKLPCFIPADLHLAAITIVVHGKQARPDLVRHTLRGLLREGPRSHDYVRMVLAVVHPTFAKELIVELRREFELGPIERQSYMFKEGKAEGKAEGRRKGRAEGLAEGLRKGECKGRRAGRHEGKVEGRVEGLAEAVRTILRSRGLALTKRLEKVLTECHDAERLKDALIQAPQVKRANDLVPFLRGRAPTQAPEPPRQ